MDKRKRFFMDSVEFECLHDEDLEPGEVCSGCGMRYEDIDPSFFSKKRQEKTTDSICSHNLPILEYKAPKSPFQIEQEIKEAKKKLKSKAVQNNSSLKNHPKSPPEQRLPYRD